MNSSNMDVNLEIVDADNPTSRTLWAIKPTSPEGKKIILEARRLACTKEYCMLSDSELIRKAGTTRSQ